MKTVLRYLKIKPVRRRQHFLFNLLNFLYFRKNEYEDRFSFESHPLSPFAVVPYILLTEAYFFRRIRCFVVLKQRIVGIIAFQEKADVLYISSLAVSPFYREIGVATHMLDYAIMVAGQLHKNAVELSVVKANAPALRLYRKFGFEKKKERRRSFILRRDLKSN